MIKFYLIKHIMKNNNAKIVVENVTKTFGARVAVNSINFSINKGEVVGFLGPNGAGKSTTMRLLTSYYTQNSGEIFIDSINTKDSDIETRKKIGYLPENNPLYGEMIVKDYLKLISDLRNMSAKDYKTNLTDAVDETGIHEYYYSPINQLSKGYRQRVGLAQAILHQPEILILDEPTEGVDVEIRQSMWLYLKQLNKEGVTIILTTHYLEEAESLCRNIAILDKGELIEQSNMKKLLLKAKHQVLIIESIDELPENITIENCDCEILDDHTLQVFQGESTSISDVVLALSTQNINVSHLRSAQNRLEALFLSLTN